MPDKPWVQRVTAITVCREGDPTFSELATICRIADESGGEFIEMEQSRDGADGQIVAFDPDEWPVVVNVANQLFGNIEEWKKGRHYA